MDASRVRGTDPLLEIRNKGFREIRAIRRTSLLEAMVKVTCRNQRHVDGVAAEVPEVIRNKREASASVAVFGEPVPAAGVARRAVVLSQWDLARHAHDVNQLPVAGGLVALTASPDNPVICFCELDDISLVRLAELAVCERAQAADRIRRVAKVMVDNV